MSAIKAVAFDFDGLMFNTEDLYEEVGHELMDRRGGRTMEPDLIQKMMGRPANVAIQIMIDWYELDDTVEGIKAESDEIFATLLPTRLQPMPGLIELLKAMEAAGMPKAITTSSGLPFIKNVLEISGLDFDFQFFLTAESVTQGKPHPEIYLKAAERFETSPSEMMVLEDSQVGCTAAIAAGTFAVAVPNRHSRQHDFSGAALVADDLHDERIHQKLV